MTKTKTGIIMIILLLAVTFGLVGANYMSVYADISFDAEKSAREQVVIARLLQIRDAEEEFRKCHAGEFCGTIDSLVDWVKNERSIDKIVKEGELTDDQLEEGMTEAEAVAQGLIVRDTIWVKASEKLGIANPDSLRYIPIGREGAQFVIHKREAFNLKSNEFDKVCEVRANLDDYLDGMPAKKIKNLKSELKKRGKNRGDLFDPNSDDVDGDWYGLRIGDLKDPQNKMSGNWE